jgi:hypothetical protein
MNETGQKARGSTASKIPHPLSSCQPRQSQGQRNSAERNHGARGRHGTKRKQAAPNHARLEGVPVEKLFATIRVIRGQGSSPPVFLPENLSLEFFCLIVLKIDYLFSLMLT